MVITERHTASIGGYLTSEEVQADDAMQWGDSLFCLGGRQEKGVDTMIGVLFVGV